MRHFERTEAVTNSAQAAAFYIARDVDMTLDSTSPKIPDGTMKSVTQARERVDPEDRWVLRAAFAYGLQRLVEEGIISKYQKVDIAHALAAKKAKDRNLAHGTLEHLSFWAARQVWADKD